MTKRTPRPISHPPLRRPRLTTCIRASAWLLIPLALPVAAAAQSTPATVPHWSTYLGGQGHDLAATVHRGPGALLTIVGTTTSSGLGTAGSFQPAYAGAGDAFVARVDPTLPAGQQVVWFTYIGGAQIDIAYDATVDAAGNTTVVGMTESAGFPMSMSGGPTTGAQTTLHGVSDGFIARIDATGATLTYATYFGGDGEERICSIAASSGSTLAIIGVTESTNLPATAGTAFPTFRGGTNDAFLASIDPAASPAQQFAWSTYVGCPATDGRPNNDLRNGGGLGVFWTGNMRRHFVEVDPSGVILAVSKMQMPAVGMTTPNALQPTGNPGDAYLGAFDPSGQVLLYGTYFGGSRNENVNAMALHPDGGVVLAGDTRSLDLPTTQGAFQTALSHSPNVGTDAFVCWIDWTRAGAAQLRYSTYFGGSGGEDLFLAVAVESSGIVTLAGTGYGGGSSPFPTTRGALLESAAFFHRCGAVARLEMRNRGAQDLAYSTLIGRVWTVTQDVVLDDVGDAILVGRTEDSAYPTVQPNQPNRAGLRDSVITHLPLLAGGTEHHDLGRAVPACTRPLYSASTGAPIQGNQSHRITATNAPPMGVGAVLFGGRPMVLPWFNIELLVEPVVISALPVPADHLGFSSVPLPIPAGLPSGTQVHTQWVFATTNTCPGSGILASTERLVITSL